MRPRMVANNDTLEQRLAHACARSLICEERRNLREVLRACFGALLMQDTIAARTLIGMIEPVLYGQLVIHEHKSRGAGESE